MILVCYGTRPEWIKIKPLLEEFDKQKIKYVTLFTGQHQNLISEHKPSLRLRINENSLNSNRLDNIVSSILDVNVFQIIKPTPEYVLVQGDTSTAMAMALSAFHNGIKVIHLEAGLRSFDTKNPYPEEVNRKIISQIADVHFCPTELNAKNLKNEGVNEKNIYVVGNTVIDNLLKYKKKCEYTDKVLITVHRRENHELIGEWFKWFDTLALHFSQYDFILPIHPNPNVQNHRDKLKYVRVIDPLPYEDMLELLVKVKFVITDSGGLQEESSFFNKMCFVCRKVTERPEALEKTSFLIQKPVELIENFALYHKNFKINGDCPYGDGHSSRKITNIIKKLVKDFDWEIKK